MSIQYRTVGKHLTHATRWEVKNLFYSKKLTPKQIANQLNTTPFSVKKILSSSAKPTQHPRRNRLVTLPIIQFTDQLISHNTGQITAQEIQNSINLKFGFSFSLNTINKLRRKLGWIKTGLHYCHLVNNTSVPVRFAWATNALVTDERFLYDTELDEASIVLNQKTRSICYRRIGQTPAKVPLPKHSFKVHVLAGISRFGKTPLVIFNGILDTTLLIEIFSVSIVPWIREVCIVLYKLCVIHVFNIEVLPKIFEII